MRLNKVFYGFTKKGDRKLLYERLTCVSTSMGDVAITLYYDMIAQKEIDSSLIDLQTLIPITNLVGPKKRMSKRKVKNVYLADNNTLIDVKGVFYGSIYNRNSEFGSRYYQEKKLKENVLFTRMDDPDCKVMDLNSFKMYPRRDRTLNGEAVSIEREINSKQFKEQMQPKRKVLEMDYRKEL